MIEGFDKEIDSLLRRAATGESVQTFDRQHLDADEISLFAENALLAKARVRATHHLAECAKCRKILSNLISFNAAAESETIHAEESNIVPVVAAPVIPWYRRLFAFPQVTFVMGGLVLVFAGIIAVMVLQNAGDMQNATVAQREEITEKSKGISGASSDGESQTVETVSNSAANTAGVNPGLPFSANTTTANSTSNTTMTNTSTTVADADVSLPTVSRQQPQMPENSQPPVKNEPQEKPFINDGQSSSNTATLNKSTTDMVAGAPAPKDSKQQQRAENNYSLKEEAERKRELGRDNLNDATRLGRTQTESPKTLATKKPASADKNKAGEARSIGGKTFRNVGGIWFDSAYTSQQQIMIRRGSDDYKRLDSGLRSIAENLGGTVVVLWKSRAYRIH